MSLDPQATLEGMARIERAAALVDAAVAAPAFDGGVLDLTGLEMGPSIVPVGDDFRLRKRLLRALGAIEVTRGPGGPARLTATPRENAEAVRHLAESLWSHLAKRGTANPEEIATRVGDEGRVEIAEGAVWLLKELQLASGIQRAGGLRLYRDFLAELAEAEVSLTREEEQSTALEGQEALHQKVYCETAALALKELGFSPTILGVRQRAAGRWNTPDVVGHYVLRSQSIVVPVLRVATVEVKHRLCRIAIAEAESHKRFAHYAYVAVPTLFSMLDRPSVTECIEKGLGVIAPNVKGGPFEVKIEASFNRADEEEVDAMLSWFRDEQDTPLKDLVSRDIRAAFSAMRS